MSNAVTRGDYFHFLMPTSEMTPRIRMGERVIFDKSAAPEADDDVVIVLSDGTIKVRRLDEITDEYILVSTYEPESTEHLDPSLVVSMWPVAWREAPDRYERLCNEGCDERALALGFRRVDDKENSNG